MLANGKFWFNTEDIVSLSSTNTWTEECLLLVRIPYSKKDDPLMVPVWAPRKDVARLLFPKKG